MNNNDYTGFEIAVIGMACRFPGASNVNEYWENLKNGVDSISVFSEEELRKYLNKEEDITNPKYIKSKGLLDNAAYFDAAFFGFSPNEANVLDPQIRILAQTAYHALEDAGYDFGEVKKNVGVFVGALPSVNWQLHCFNNAGNQYSEQFSSLILNDKDFASTRLSYLLNLHGPSSTIYTACSTSLVTIDMACQSLLTGKSNMAMAGGVALSLPYKSGYLHEQGMIMSKDGHTRSFDENATGTVWSDGVGMVVLKRLEDAINDGDQIHAIIKGSGVNNDGDRKVGYTAPSIQGQIEVIRDALNMAEVSLESIKYIEGHGSATSLGDKIEISALSEVFKNANENYKCPIGSVKSNVGHLNTASGIAGFIKVCLMLKHSQIPPTAHFERPNSTLAQKKCPFYVTNTLQEWKSENTPLRAGVSSFGIGGTNAHIVLEEAPAAKKSKEDARNPLLVLSAKTRDSLHELSSELKEYILQHPSKNINDVAYTLQIGRKHYQHRKSVLFENKEQLLKSLATTTSETINETPKIVMMFPGMGTVYTNLGKDLYHKEYIFRKTMDECFSILKAKTGQNYKAILYPENESQIPKDFQTPQLLTFAFEYSLYTLLKSWGITPDYLIGYSLGEYVAACVADIFTVASTFDILIERGNLINSLDTGGMLAVPLSAEAIQPYLPTTIDIAINNGKSIVVGGEQKALQVLKKDLETAGIGTIEINASYALHSSEMKPILTDFNAIIAKHTPKIPKIPMISNVTGNWCDAAVTETTYWAKHLSETIEFHKGLTTLIKEHPTALFLEVGAGNNLSLLARRTGNESDQKLNLVNFVKKEKVKTTDHDYLLKAIGSYWQYGGNVNWEAYHDGLHKNIVSLPNYPFEKKTFDILPKNTLEVTTKTANFSKQSDISSWFYVPTWQRNPLLTKVRPENTDGKTILILGNQQKDIKGLLSEKEVKDTIVFAQYDENFSKIREKQYALDYTKKDDIITLFKAFEAEEIKIDVIIDVTNVGKSTSNDIKNLQRIVTLFQGISRTSHAYHKLEYCIVVENVFSIYGNEQINPWNSILLSATKVIPQENPFVQCRFIEIDAETYISKRNLYYQQILKEQESYIKDKIVSYRGVFRWIQNMLPYPLASNDATASQIRHKGTYIIIGGLGDVGYAISKYLLEKFETTIILIGRSQLPEKSNWESWLQENDATSSLGSKISKALDLVKLPGNIEFMQADSTVYEDLATVFKNVQERYAQIDGVFHSAGAIAQNSFNVVNSISEEQLEFHFPVKTKGLDVIEKVVDEYPVKFVAIMSSLSSILGGLGMIGYAGANQFMDAMVARQNNTNSATKWMTFNFSNWEGWDTDFEGLSLSDSALETFITSDEGEKVFNGLFSQANAHSQIIISPVNLFALKEKWENTQETIFEDKQNFDNESNTKPELSSDYKEPTTNLQKELVHIWEEIFGFGPIGILDDFMELGGDSLKAITMLSHVHGKTTMTMSIQDFFNNTTIEKLSKTIKQTEFKAIPKIAVQDAYPVTASQQRLWILSQMGGGSAAYNLYKVIKFKGVLDIEKFQEAFNILINRHHSIRTYFKATDEGELFQLVKTPEEIDFKIRYLEEKEFTFNTLNDFLIAEQAEAFDLAEAPLFRANLIKINPDEHVFCFVMHHIISDGWSMEILISEVVENYNSLYKNETINREELAIQYTDYTAWLKEQQTSKSYQKTEAYWLSKFSGSLPVLELPKYGNRPKVLTYNGKTIRHAYSEAFSGKLKQFSKEQDVTLFMTLMTGLNTLFHRYTNQDDIIVGTPVAGRTHSDVQNQIGHYLNTLAIRTTIAKEDSFYTLLKKQKKNLLEAFDHQEYSFDDLVGKLNIKRDTSRSALFDIMVVLQSQSQIKAIQSAIQLEGVQAIPYDIESKTTKFDATFAFIETDVIELEIEYNVDIYDEELMRRMFAHFENLMEMVMANPNEVVNAIPYITASELALTTQGFNDTKTSYATDKTIIEYFEEHVTNSPDAIALVFEENELSYAELNIQANRLARHLEEEGKVFENDLVGLLLHRSEWMVISILAILKARCAYVPIHPEHPQERINYFIEDSNCKLVIDEKFFKEFQSQQAKYTKENKIINPVQERIAYVIYTSGSTGNPKGVCNTHAGLLNRLFWMRKLLNITENSVLVQKTPYTFDVSVWELLMFTVTGSKLVIAAPNGHKDPDYLQTLIATKNIRLIHFVPSMLRAFLDAIHPEKCKNLQQIVCSGEALSSQVVEKCKTLLPWVNVFNLYGPTEATIDVTAIDLSNVDTQTVGVSIGKPVANTKIYIVNEHLLPQPIGVSGELLIEGIQVAKGYINRDELNAEKFIQSPFHQDQPMYRTGDICRWMPNGTIDFLGRADNQVKIKGYRIELGEIENSLAKIQHILQAVVIVKGEDEAKFLVAYYLSDKELDKNAIQTLLRKELPEYMVPQYFVEVETIPLSANGKVDTKALPEIQDDDLIKTTYIAPRTAQEKMIAVTWGKVLKQTNVGIKDNFYHLGGDSIKAIMVVSGLKQQGYSLKVDLLLKYPVLEDLATLLEIKNNTIEQGTVIGNVALTPIQYDFFENNFISNKNHFNQSILLHSKEELHTEKLTASIHALVKHHDALRMTFKKEDTSWTQFNADVSNLIDAVTFYDVRNEENELKAIQSIGNQLQSSFVLEQGNLLRLAHFRSNKGDFIALIAHHLVMDGVSWRILIEDLAALYKNELLSTKDALPMKTDSYKNWAEALQIYPHEFKLQKERSYWKHQLQREIPKFPIVKEVEASFWEINQEVKFFINEAQTKKLTTVVHKAFNTEINDVLLTALGLALKEVFDIKKTMLCLEGHGREKINDQIDVSRTIGWFTSKYPFVLATKNTEIASVINIKDNLRTIPNKGIGYGILHYLDTKFDREFTPSIQFNYLGEFDQRTSEEDAIFALYKHQLTSNVDQHNKITTFLLDIIGSIRAGKFQLSIHYSDSCYESTTIEELSNSYKKHLELLIEKLSIAQTTQLTPSDLTYKELSFETLTTVNEEDAIEDIYELTPLQQGLYFHWLKDRNSIDYFEQLSYYSKIKNLDTSHLQGAFQLLVERHTILRTSFNNTLGDVPLQIVYKDVKANFSYEVLSGNKNEIQEKTAILRNADKSKGFHLETPQLIRLKVVEINEEEYFFNWSFHHIIMDGWCIGTLVNDFYKIWISLHSEVQVLLPEVAPYATYIDWLSAVDKKSSAAHWKNYLKGINEVTEIPFKNHPSLQTKITEAIRTEKLSITASRFQKVQLTSRDLGITLNTYIQGVWGYLLSKYNNSETSVFGSVVSGRPPEIQGVENMIGLFINTIPVKVETNNEDTPASFLKRLYQESLDNIPNQYLDLADIQALSPLKEHLITSLFVFENYINQFHNISDEHIIEEGNSIISVRDVEVFERTNYDFTVLVFPKEDQFEIRFQYREDLYDTESIKVLVKHFEKLLEAFYNETEKPLQTLDILAHEEKEHIINAYSHGKKAIKNTPETVIDLYEKQVVKNANQLAVIFKDAQLTYAELDIEVNKFANYLIKRGNLQDGAMIGIQLHRSEWVVIAMLGILKSGAAYVPIDPEYPQDRIDYIVSDSNAQIIIDQAWIEEYLSHADTISSDVVIANIQPTDPAYMIYTSGSTGRPKGVILNHKNVENLVTHCVQNTTLEFDKVLQYSTISFDVSFSEIFYTLCAGGSLYLLEEAVRNDLTQLFNFIEHYKITTVFLPMSLLRTIFSNEDIMEDIPSCIKHIQTAGEQVVINTNFEHFLKKQKVTLHNHYGPSETHVSTLYEIHYDVEIPKLPPIGKPIQNTYNYIVDRCGKLQPFGIPGELWIGGDAVGDGYQNREELTKEKFIENPFLLGTKIYKSGDLVKWLPDGNIEFLGRIDRQVKIRGFRVEPSEIEQCLLNIPEVREAVVHVSTAKDGNKQLAAYLVSDNTLDIKRIKQVLAQYVPDYMIPSVFMQIDTIPLTHNKKIDLKALPKIEQSNNKEIIKPIGIEEEQLIQICAEVLQLDAANISMDDVFFDIGGHSIKAMLLISRIRKRLGVSLSLSDVFEVPNLSDLAALIKKTGTSKSITIAPVAKKPYYKASSIQRRLYYLQMLSPTMVSYNMPVAYEIKGEVNLEKIEKSCYQLIMRHESLRTSFEVIDAKIVQKIHTQPHFKVCYEESVDTDYERHTRNFLQPFNLSQAPLFRAKLITYTKETHLLILDFHHIISDAFSINILTNDFMALYQGMLLPPLKLHYKAYAEWQYADTYIETQNRQREYWKHKLSGTLHKVQLPSVGNKVGGAKYTIKIEEANTQKIKEFIKQQKVTLNIFFQSVFIVLLSKISYQETIILGTPMAGRRSSDLETIVGMFVNTVVLVNHPEKGKIFSDFLAETKRTALEAFDNQEFPFDELVTLIGAREQNGSNPIFNIMFEFQNVDVAQMEVENLELTPRFLEENDSKFDLTLEIQERNNVMDIQFKYAKRFFDTASIQSFSDNFLFLIEQVLMNKDLKLNDLTILKTAEEEDIFAQLSKPIDDL